VVAVAADPPDDGHKPPRTDIPVQSAHIHDQGWHRRVVPVTIGVLDGLLVRPARGAIAAARTPGLASVMQAGERLAHVGWLTADAAPA